MQDGCDWVWCGDIVIMVCVCDGEVIEYFDLLDYGGGEMSIEEVIEFVLVVQ